MKKLKLWKKILLILSVSLLLLMSVVPASADVVEDGNFYSGDAALTAPTGFRALLVETTDNQVYWVTDNAIFPNSNGSYNFSNYLSVFNMSTGDYSLINTDYSFNGTRSSITSKLKFYNQNVAHPDYLQTVSKLRFEFGSQLYNNDLTQNSIYLGSRISDESLEQEVFYNYTGYVQYPTIDGSTALIPYSIGYYTVFENGVIPRVTYTPTKMHPNGNPWEKIDMYSYVYTYASEDQKRVLKDPSYLSDYSVLLVDCSLTIEFEQFPYSTGGSPWNIIQLDEFVTPNGVYREGESYSEWVAVLNPSEPDINKYNFSDFVVDIFNTLLNLELFPGFKLYMPLALVIAIACIIWLLKAFAGG